MNKDKGWEKEFKQKFAMFAILGGERLYNGGFDNNVRVQDVIEFIRKQLTKAKEEGRREGVKGFVYYLFPSEMYHSSDVKDEFWWSRGDAFIEAEKYLKSLRNKK